MLGMSYVRRLATSAIASADSYRSKRLLTDNKFDQKIDKLIGNQELFSPPLSGVICDDLRFKTPDNYTKIIPGKTPGFDHVKFAHLKAKYLDAVSQEYLALVEKAGIDKAQACPSAANFKMVKKVKDHVQAYWNTHPLKHDPLEVMREHDYKTCSTKIDGKTCKFIIDKFKKHGLRAENIIIDKVSSEDDTVASVEWPFNFVPYDMAILKIYSNDACFKISSDPLDIKILDTGDCFVSMSQMQLYDRIIEHECSHLLHKDYYVWRLFPLSQRENLMKIQEKRADVFSVFNCQNPIATVIGASRKKKHNDLYDHRASSEWHVMADEIRSCYSDEIQAKWRSNLLMRTVCYAFGRSLLFPKIEHISE